MVSHLNAETTQLAMGGTYFFEERYRNVSAAFHRNIASAVTPLMIAAHTSALMASTFVKLRANPTKVASASTA